MKKGFGWSLFWVIIIIIIHWKRNFEIAFFISSISIIGTYLLEFGDLDCQVVVTLDSEHGHAVTWAVSTYTPTM